MSVTIVTARRDRCDLRAIAAAIAALSHRHIDRASLKANARTSR